MFPDRDTLIHALYASAVEIPAWVSFARRACEILRCDQAAVMIAPDEEAPVGSFANDRAIAAINALAADNVVALCTEPDFWDERYYALSTLSEYLNSLPPEQILSDGHMRVYLLDASLAEALRQSMSTADAGA